jgi:hypothetical protein
MRGCCGVVLFTAWRLNRTRRERVIDKSFARRIELRDESHQQPVIDAAARWIAHLCGGCDIPDERRKTAGMIRGTVVLKRA